MGIEKGSRQVLIHGLFFILVALIWGLFIPHTPYPRLALGAHIQFAGSGIILLIAALLLLKLPHQVGRKSVFVILLSAWLTWGMALSEVANSWWGTTRMLSIAAQQANATGGAPWQEKIVLLAHIVAAFGLIAAWTLLVIGFVKKVPPTSAHNI